MSKGITIILIILFFLQLSYAQSVWPGDVNNNGVVNKIDLLYLGYAFNTTGPARGEIDGTWGAKNSPNFWENTFPNGVNFAYADCNGDGSVDALDAAFIEQNVGQRHNDIPFVPDEMITGNPDEDPACKFQNPPTSISSDEMITLELALGEDVIPVDDVSGITFSINIEPDIIGLNNSQVIFKEDSWIEATANKSIALEQKNEERATYKVGFTKTDQMPVSGAGPIATFSFVVIGDIVDFLQIDSMEVQIDSITVLNGSLEPIPIAGDTIQLAINRGGTVSIEQHPALQAIEVYPNPNRGYLLIKSPETTIEKIEIVNIFGQSLLHKEVDSSSIHGLHIGILSSGAYWLKIYTLDGVKMERIIRIE